MTNDKILKLLTDLGFTTNNRRLYKSEDSTGYDVFYNVNIKSNFYSALIGFSKISDNEYKISSLNLSNGSLDNYIEYCSFPYPSSLEKIYDELQIIFKYEIRKMKLEKLKSFVR